MTKAGKYLVGLGIVVILAATGLYYMNHNGSKGEDPGSEAGSGNTAISGSDISPENGEISPGAEVYSVAEGAAATAGAEAESKEAEADQAAIEANISVLVNKYFDLAGEYDSSILTSKTKADKKKGQEIFNRKKEVIEKYENIKEIVKPGLTEDTYIVFTTYDIKMKNVETLVPGMSVLVIGRDEAGGLLISNGKNDDSLTEYINQTASEDDELKAIIEEVNKKLAAALKEDSSLKQMVEYLKELS